MVIWIRHCEEGCSGIFRFFVFPFQAQRELGVLYTEDEMKDMKHACELFEEAAAQEVCDFLIRHFKGRD